MKKLRSFLSIKGLNRIIDANINRVKEGLRVCEEITRFILNSRGLTAQLKKIRHKIHSINKRFVDAEELLKERRASKDVGKEIYMFELKRRNYQDIFLANIQRVKESVRVLEEFAKLKDTSAAIEFKKIRYSVYEIEKKIAKKIASLCDSR